jgi:CDP-paratose 2-epimerase
MRILITGGAGFVGSSLALAFRREQPGARVVAFDSLRRRGSERKLGLLRRHGVDFVHGDIRQPADLEALPGGFDVVIDAAAEPSVRAGSDGAPGYVIETNLLGTLHCLEFCRRRAGHLIFLSTSRVYSIEALRALPLEERETRFELRPAPPPRKAPAAAPAAALPGVSLHGLAESFPTDRARSFYGASKLAAELLVQEYAAGAGVSALVDRCGVIAGPGQLGREDQGVFSLWVARHHFRRPLRYTGFGGTGKQVRDLLHPEDLFDLITRQLPAIDAHRGAVFNVGGGPVGSTSLREWTAICSELTGHDAAPAADPATHPVDVPYYVSDHRRASAAFDWKPRRGPREIAADVLAWLRAGEDELRDLFAEP